MSAQKRIILLIVIMLVIVAAASGAAIAILYDTAFHEGRARLVEMVRSQARLMEAMATFNRRATPPGDVRQALSGESGWLVGLDYRGTRVLAAYEPVAILDRGGVAKIDLAEIRQPFRTARNVVMVITLFLVGLGAFLFWRIARPMVSTIRQSGGRLQDFADAAADRFWETDREFRFTYISPFKSTMPHPPKNLLGKARWETDPEAPFWRPLRADVAARVAFRDFRYVLKNENGESWHIRISGKPFFDKKGRFQGYRGTSLDETAEVKARESAEGNRKRFADSMDRLAAGFSLWDEQNRFVWCNRNFISMRPAIAQFLTPGLHFEDYIRKVAEGGDVEDSKGREEEWIALRVARLNAANNEHEAHLADGRWLHIQNQRMEDGSVLVFHYDITEHKRAEESLKESEKRARAFLNATMDGAALVDRKGIIIDLNQAMAERIGKPVEELKGTSLVATFPPEVAERRRSYTQQVIRTGVPSCFTDERQGLWFETNHYPIFDEDGKVVQVAIFARDVTSQKRDAAKLIEAKEEADRANRAKSDFLASMSHELRSPLNAIIGFSEIIMSRILGPGAEEKYTQYASDINHSGHHLLSLIDDILNLSKIEAGKFVLDEEEAEVGEMIESALGLVKKNIADKGVALHTDLADGLPSLRVDRDAVQQMLLNLLSNAIEFTPQGGSISVRVAIDGEGGLTLSVADTGVGIAPADMPLVMAPFGQAKNVNTRDFPGTGLGIPIVQSLIELHGGSLELESELGVGTTASLHFPPERSVRAA